MRKVILYGIIPLLLIGFWLIATLAFNNTIPFTSLIYTHSTNTIQAKSAVLLKGSHVTGQFTADQDNLGIVELPIALVHVVNYSDEDVLHFAIKQKGSSQWYYEGTYRSGIFNGHAVFPFGFPRIADSAGREYVFELISLRGNQKNALVINTKEKFSTVYSFSKHELLINKNSLIKFVFNKVINTFLNINILIISIIYFLPFIAYMIFILPHKGLATSTLTSRLLGVFILIDTVGIKETYGVIVFGLMLFWLLVVLYFKFNSKISFLYAIAFTILMPVFLLVGQNTAAEKAATYVFLFMVVGTIQDILEIDKINIRKYLPLKGITAKKK